MNSCEPRERYVEELDKLMQGARLLMTLTEKEKSATIGQQRPFAVVKDHTPLQWLSAQKMEGVLTKSTKPPAPTSAPLVNVATYW